MTGWLERNASWLARAAERWSPRRVEPLRIRVWLASPVSWDGYNTVQLEGALQTVIVMRETGRLPDDVFHGIPHGIYVDIRVPIADVQIGRWTIACASSGMPPSIAVEATRWRRKRVRPDAFGTGMIRINGGPFKALNLPMPTLATPYLDFFVRGDRELLADLLRDVGGIGRDSVRGLGSVHGIEIDDDPEDRSLVWNGRPQRPIPIVSDGGPFDIRNFDVAHYDVRRSGTRAPYWRSWMATMCAVPVLRVGMMEAAA